jgi:DNA polymerase-1
MVEKETPFIVADSNYLGHRAKHAMGELATQGQGTGVIYGFLVAILELAQRFHTNRFVFAWDSKHSWRKKEFAGYKKKRHTRTKTPKEAQLDKVAFEQFEQLRLDLLPDIGFNNQFIQAGLEGDDMMAEFVLGNLGEYILVASDQDLYQLLSFNCRMWNPQKKEETTADSFYFIYGIEPHVWAEVKAIAGCSSDEVPGVVGVAEKTAAKYLRGALKPHLKTFKDIESDHGQMLADRNWPLVKLPHEKTKPLVWQPDTLSMAEFIAICEELEFDSFLRPGKLSEWEDFFSGAVLNERPKRGTINQNRIRSPRRR